MARMLSRLNLLYMHAEKPSRKVVPNRLRGPHHIRTVSHHGAFIIVGSLCRAMLLVVHLSRGIA